MLILHLNSLNVPYNPNQMNTYNERLTRFFLQSIHTLKKESGGQRWNLICEDTADFALHKAPNYFSTFPFLKEQLWQLFFHPPETVQESSCLQWFLHQENSPKFLFLILLSLTDPPYTYLR